MNELCPNNREWLFGFKYKPIKAILNMKEITFIIPKGMDKHTWMFYDNCRFWNSMGVQKEDNVIALALADMNLACRIPYRIDDWKSYYKEIYERIVIEIKNPKYNERRGQNDFLLGSGL